MRATLSRFAVSTGIHTHRGSPACPSINDRRTTVSSGVASRVPQFCVTRSSRFDRYRGNSRFCATRSSRYTSASLGSLNLLLARSFACPWIAIEKRNETPCPRVPLYPPIPKGELSRASEKVKTLWQRPECLYDVELRAGCSPMILGSIKNRRDPWLSVPALLLCALLSKRLPSTIGTELPHRLKPDPDVIPLDK